MEKIQKTKTTFIGKTLDRIAHELQQVHIKIANEPHFTHTRRGLELQGELIEPVRGISSLVDTLCKLFDSKEEESVS